MSDTANADDRGEFLVTLLSDVNSAISELVDLSVAWSNGDFPRAHAKCDLVFARLERAAAAAQGEATRSARAQRYLHQLDDVRDQLTPLRPILANRIG